jgi:hypothetical protein
MELSTVSILSTVALLLFILPSSVNSQSSVDASQGFDAGPNAGIALAICAVTLLTTTLLINLMRWKVVSQKARREGAIK